LRHLLLLLLLLLWLGMPTLGVGSDALQACAKVTPGPETFQYGGINAGHCSNFCNWR
jgi:hypothetical protein